MTPPLISRTGSTSKGSDQNERGNDDVIDSDDSDGMENWDTSWIVYIIFC